MISNIFQATNYYFYSLDVRNCLLFSFIIRMKRYRGHNPKDSISGFIKKKVLSRTSSADSTATVRYTTSPAVRAHDVDSLYDEIPASMVYGQTNNGFQPDSLDSSFSRSPHVTADQRGIYDTSYITLIDYAEPIDEKSPQPCPRTSLKQSVNNGYLTTSMHEGNLQNSRQSSSNQLPDNGYLRVSLDGKNPQPCPRSSLKQDAAAGYLSPGSPDVLGFTNPAPDYE